MAKILQENLGEPSVKILRDKAGPRSSGRGVVDSKFSEASLILSKFYACAGVFWLLFVDTKSSNLCLYTQNLHQLLFIHRPDTHNLGFLG